MLNIIMIYKRFAVKREFEQKTNIVIEGAGDV